MLVLAIVALASSRDAHAHASLVATDPADGSIVAERPDAFRLTFNEPVSPLVLKLVAPDGSVSELTRRTLEGPALTLSAPAAMPAGTYVLSWRVVSLDGHPVGGTIAFSVGHPSATPVLTSSSAGWPLRLSIWIVRTLLYFGLFLGIGSSLFRALVAPLPPAARTLGLAAALAGLAAAGVSLGLQGLDALDAPPEAYFHATIWAAGLSTTYAITAAVAALALFASIAALMTKAVRPAAILAVIAAAGVGLALAASGHASDAPPQWLTRPAVFVHAVALVFWIGALPPLAFTLRRGGEAAAAALARFSRLIPFAIVALVLSGLALAIVQVRAPAALAGTAYGRVLLAKLGLVVLLFGLAAWNRFSLTKRAGAGDAPAIRNLVGSILFETLLVVAILGVVTLWRFTPPPRALAAAIAPSVEVHIHGDKAMAHLSISPGRVGPVSASIAIMAEGSEPIEPREVTLVVSKSGSGIEPISRPAHRIGDGVWQVDGLVIPLAGNWSVRVELLVSDFEEIRLEAPVEIGP